jgi:hypothetical protein
MAAIRQAFSGRASTIGTIIASGGTGKNELSANEITASHFSACGPSASRKT